MFIYAIYEYYEVRGANIIYLLIYSLNYSKEHNGFFLPVWCIYFYLIRNRHTCLLVFVSHWGEWSSMCSERSFDSHKYLLLTLLISYLVCKNLIFFLFLLLSAVRDTTGNVMKVYTSSWYTYYIFPNFLMEIHSSS